MMQPYTPFENRKASLICELYTQFNLYTYKEVYLLALADKCIYFSIAIYATKLLK